MRIVAVSMVKNEADVIEAFARHTAAFVDAHLVFDHASTDGTGFVLAKLQREGLPLRFFHDDRPEYLQTHRTHRLLDRALADHAADWVVPLDADEFIQCDGGPAAFRARLAGLLPAGRPVRLWMRDHIATADDDPREPNPVRRVTRRTSIPHVTKALLPRAFAVQPGNGWVNGNHHPRAGAAAVESDVLEDAWLAHFACRSSAQAVVKVVQYHLRRLAEGSSTTIGDNYAGFFRQLATLPGQVLADPRVYHEPDETGPADYHGGPLRYPPPLTPTDAAVVAVLSAAERVAADHGRLLDAVRTLTPPPGRAARARWWLRQLVRGGRSPAALPEPVDRLAPDLRDGLLLPDSRGGAGGLACRLSAAVVGVSASGVQLEVTATNTGVSRWLRATADGVGAVRVGVQAVGPGGELVDREHHRADLPADVDPGDAVTLRTTAPPAAEFRVDLVCEGVRWFGFRGCVVPAGGTRGAAA